MRTQEVLYNLAGQSWFYDPPEGRPDPGSPPATCTIVLNLSGDDVSIVEAATTGACALDSVNTTTTAQVLAQANAIALTSASGVTRGRRYQLIGASGDREWVEVLTINGLNITTRRPVMNTYASGAAFVSNRITIGVDPTWVATKAKISDVLATTWKTTKESNAEWMAGYAGYRLRWTYAVNSVALMGVSYGDLVRYNAKSLVTPLDVDSRFPGWIDRLTTDQVEDQGASVIDEAFHAVRMDAVGDDQVVRRIRQTEILRELTIFRANLLLAEAQVMSGAPPTILVEAKRLYEQRFNQLMREPKYQADQLGDGSAGAARRLPITRR